MGSKILVGGIDTIVGHRAQISVAEHTNSMYVYIMCLDVCVFLLNNNNKPPLPGP